MTLSYIKIIFGATNATRACFFLIFCMEHANTLVAAEPTVKESEAELEEEEEEEEEEEDFALF